MNSSGWSASHSETYPPTNVPRGNPGKSPLNVDWKNHRSIVEVSILCAGQMVSDQVTASTNNSPLTEESHVFRFDVPTPHCFLVPDGVALFLKKSLRLSPQNRAWFLAQYATDLALYQDRDVRCGGFPWPSRYPNSWMVYKGKSHQNG